MNGSSLLIAIACASSGAFASDLVIDDFKTGQYNSPQLKSGIFTNVQTGSMQGGSRSITMDICTGSNCRAQNPFSDVASFKVAASRDPKNPAWALIQNAGFEVYPRIDLVYGATPGHLDLDLSAYDRLRFNFMSTSETLNFNVQLFDDTGLYIQGGCNYAAHDGPFALELPFSAFVKPGGPIDMTHVTYIDAIFQAASVAGANEFAVDNVSASNSTQSGASTCEYAQ